MMIEEIKRNMVFRDNRKNLNRRVKVIAVDKAKPLISLWVIDEREERLFNSNCPHRFHLDKKCSGYSLVSE